MILNIILPLHFVLIKFGGVRNHHYICSAKVDGDAV